MTEHIYLKKLGTMDRQKYFRNLSLKATRTAETVITKCSDSIHLFKLKNELFHPFEWLGSWLITVGFLLLLVLLK